MTDRNTISKVIESLFEDWIDKNINVHPLAVENMRLLEADAIAMIKEQEHKDRMFHELEKDWKRQKALLKEQEAEIRWIIVYDDGHTEEKYGNSLYSFADDLEEEPVAIIRNGWK